MTYDKLIDSLKDEEGNEISPKAPLEERLEASARYIIHLIRTGKNLTDLPKKSKVVPILADILDFIDQNPKLSEAYAKAQSKRIKFVEEEMLKALDAFSKDLSPDSKDYYQACKEAYTNLAKRAPQQDANVQIEFHGILPKEMWDGIGKKGEEV